MYVLHNYMGALRAALHVHDEIHTAAAEAAASAAAPAAALAAAPAADPWIHGSIFFTTNHIFSNEMKNTVHGFFCIKKCFHGKMVPWKNICMERFHPVLSLLISTSITQT